MKCEVCSSELPEKTGDAGNKVGPGMLGGVNGLGSGAKNGFKGSEEERKE